MFLIENAIHIPDTFGTRRGVFIQLSTYRGHRYNQVEQSQNILLTRLYGIYTWSTYLDLKYAQYTIQYIIFYILYYFLLDTLLIQSIVTTQGTGFRSMVSTSSSVTVRHTLSVIWAEPARQGNFYHLLWQFQPTMSIHEWHDNNIYNKQTILWIKYLWFT
jgi:hypothetical protein